MQCSLGIPDCDLRSSNTYRIPFSQQRQPTSVVRTKLCVVRIFTVIEDLDFCLYTLAAYAVIRSPFRLLSSETEFARVQAALRDAQVAVPAVVVASLLLGEYRFVHKDVFVVVLHEDRCFHTAYGLLSIHP